MEKGEIEDEAISADDSNKSDNSVFEGDVSDRNLII